MTAVLGFVLIALAPVVALLLVELAKTKHYLAEAEHLIAEKNGTLHAQRGELVECRAQLARKDSLIAALRTSHDEVQDIALKALRGDYDRAAERRADR